MEPTSEGGSPPKIAAGLPPVVFVHGAWHGAWCWEHLETRFEARGHEVHCVELRDHGARGSGAEPMRWNRIRDYVDDVREAISAVPEPPIVVAHSMGGFVVQKLLSDPPSLHRVVLLAPAPAHGVGRTMLRLARRHPLRALWATARMDLYTYVSSPALVREHFFSKAASDALVHDTAARVNSEAWGAFLDMLGLDLPKPRPCPVPMLVVAAGEDRVFAPSEMEATARAWGADYVLVPGLGHDLMLEPGWPRVAEAVETWLEG